MSKYDDLLNEVVYKIDDIVYDFYSKSNALIAKKKAQERLIDFREKTLNTINDMNVRSLEIIASLKDEQLVQTRIDTLLEKNHNIIESSLSVIEMSPNRIEILSDISELANNVFESAKKTVEKVEESETFEKIKTKTAQGVQKTKDVIEDISTNPNVVKSAEYIKEKTKEVVEVSAALVRDGAKKASEWYSDFNEKKDKENTSEEETAFGPGDVVASDFDENEIAETDSVYSAEDADKGEHHHEESNDL